MPAEILSKYVFCKSLVNPISSLPIFDNISTALFATNNLSSATQSNNPSTIGAESHNALICVSSDVHRSI